MKRHHNKRNIAQNLNKLDGVDLQQDLLSSTENLMELLQQNYQELQNLDIKKFLFHRG